jgi:hypothetical protein
MCARAQVLDNHELQGPGSDRSTRHVRLALPGGEGGAYVAGEHLEVMPNNDAALVDAALALLGLTGARALCVCGWWARAWVRLAAGARPCRTVCPCGRRRSGLNTCFFCTTFPTQTHQHTRATTAARTQARSACSG